MTSEVIIYNKEALAMAADSAVTINSGNKLKTYNTANKLFMLSKFHPIGILIYNNSIINNIPVEILIKEYRKQLWKKSFNTIQDYCDDFQKFLNKFLNEQVKKEKNVPILTIEQLKNKLVISYLQYIFSIIQNNNPNPFFIYQINTFNFNNFIKNKLKNILLPLKNNQKNLTSLFTDEELSRLLKMQLTTINIDIQTDDVLSILIEYFYVYQINYLNQISTGFAICGYGEKEYSPVVSEFKTLGIIDNKLFVFDGKNHSDKSSAIIPLAQRNMIDLFIKGIDDNIIETVKCRFSDIINDILSKVNSNIASNLNNNANTTIKDKLLRHNETIFQSKTDVFNKYLTSKIQNNLSPILETLPHLSKEELSTFCESLVSLQALKHKVSLNLETVGGPIDVAIISKHDGFIWKKRKFYFDSNLNNHFFENYFVKDESDSKHNYFSNIYKRLKIIKHKFKKVN